MAVPDKAQTVPAVKEQSAKTRETGTAARDLPSLFAVLLSKPGTAHACTDKVVPRFQAAMFVSFQT